MYQKKNTNPDKKKEILTKETERKIKFIWWIIFQALPIAFSRVVDFIDLWV
ncbi:MAG: hypothetical protein JNM21_14815 [Taibaiella sp.]|nr:hypothetical protein [Taibaiella sp.]